MDCPVCREAMIVLELEQVEIDRCTDCGGIWLDDGELELLLENSSDKERFLATLQVDPGCREAKRKCPLCSKKMQKVLCGVEKEICIDQCTKHGLWFDAGELHDVLTSAHFDPNDKILMLLKDMMGNKSSGFPLSRE